MSSRTQPVPQLASGFIQSCGILNNQAGTAPFIGERPLGRLTPVQFRFVPAARRADPGDSHGMRCVNKDQGVTHLFPASLQQNCRVQQNEFDVTPGSFDLMPDFLSNSWMQDALESPQSFLVLNACSKNDSCQFPPVDRPGLVQNPIAEFPDKLLSHVRNVEQRMTYAVRVNHLDVCVARTPGDG